MGLSVFTLPTARPIHVDEAKDHIRLEEAADDTLVGAYIDAAVALCQTTQGRQYVDATYDLTCDGLTDGTRLPRPPLAAITSITYVDTDGATQALATTVYTALTDTLPGQVVLAYNQTWPQVRAQAEAVKVRYVAGYVTPFTVDAGTDVVTTSGRTFTDGDKIRLSNSGGALPAGLAGLTDYYVRDVSNSTMKLAATSGGSAIDITGVGTGAHFVGALPETIRAAILLLVGGMYENREAYSIQDVRESSALRSLLWADKVVEAL